MEPLKVIISIEEYQKLQETIKDQNEIIETFKKGENAVFFIHRAEELHYSFGHSYEHSLYAKEIICDPKHQKEFMKQQIEDIKNEFIGTLNIYESEILRLKDKNKELLEYRNLPWYKKLF